MLQLPENEKSYWREAYPARAIYPKLSDDVHVDVAIIGAGITGLTAAYLLKQSGQRVAVLDKSTVGSGTTGRTTGKVTAQHDLVYTDLERRLGTQAARQYGQANQAAIGQVDTIIRTENIACDWQRDTNYVFTADPQKVTLFEQEAHTAASLGLPATFETESPLPFEIQAAVAFADQGKINSQKYVLGLARAVNSNGSFVFEHSNVVGIRDGDPCNIRTGEAAVIAKHIIVATNVPTFPLLARVAYGLLEYPTESYAVAGRLKQKMPGMYISPDKQHYSILPVETNGEHVLLIVGEGRFSPLQGNSKARYQRLADYAERHFDVPAITHRWSDRDYLAYDGIPLIGKVYPWSKHLYVATGFKKWGLSNGTVAGMILRDLVTGVPNPWTATFNANRFKPVTSIPWAITSYLTRKQ